MTVETRSPAVWRAYDALANVDAGTGPTYSPPSLRMVRWLAARPGATSEEMSRVHRQPRPEVRNRLRRLERLGLVEHTSDDNVWPQRWWLTADGREFVKLIDAEGVA